MLGLRRATRGGRPLVSEYDGRQFGGIDLHRCRTVIVRQSESGEHLGCLRVANDPLTLSRRDRQGQARAGSGARGDVSLVLGRGRAGRGRGSGASRAPVGCEGVRVSAGEERWRSRSAGHAPCPVVCARHAPIMGSIGRGPSTAEGAAVGDRDGRADRRPGRQHPTRPCPRARDAPRLGDRRHRGRWPAAMR